MGMEYAQIIEMTSLMSWLLLFFPMLAGLLKYVLICFFAIVCFPCSCLVRFQEPDQVPNQNRDAVDQA